MTDLERLIAKRTREFWRGRGYSLAAAQRYAKKETLQMFLEFTGELEDDSRKIENLRQVLLAIVKDM